MKLLLIESNTLLTYRLSEALRCVQFTVDHTSDGGSADILLLTQHYDVVLLDLQPPTLSGQGVLQRLYGRRNPVPMLILIASGGIDDKVAHLGVGADDYLAKPLEIRELIAWIRVLVRCSTPDQSVELQRGDLIYHTDSRTFNLIGQPLVLPTREHTMLGILMFKLGCTVPKPALMNDVFGIDDEASPEAIGIYIRRLRKKLEHSVATIATLRGPGYPLRDVFAARS